MKYLKSFKLWALLALSATLMVSTLIVSAQKKNNSSPLAEDVKYTSRQEKNKQHKVQFSLSLNEAGLSYFNQGKEDIERFGPSALLVDGDGIFHLVDPVSNQVLRVTSKGEALRPIKIEGAVGITDIALNGNHLFVLDESAIQPIIFEVNKEGDVLNKFTLPESSKSQGLSGIDFDNGDLVIEFEDGSKAETLYGVAKLKNGFGVESKVSSGKEGHHVQVTLDGKAFAQIPIKHQFAGAYIVGRNENGDVFVAVSQMESTPEISVDQQVYRFSKDGKLMGVARVPLNDYFTYVKHPLAMGPDGELYCLVTRPDRIEVLQLSFSKKITDTLPKGVFNCGETNVSEQELNAACTRTRDQMVSQANSYLQNQVSLSSTNISGRCLGRGKPRYLGSAGRYASVPYDWGGWELPNDFNALMSQRYQAGDIDTTSVEGCSKGVDCSGFVSRAWGVSSKLSTSTIPNVSTAISANCLKTGDAINKPGDHVVMFERHGGPGGVYAWEATVNNNVDRVVYAFSSWARLNGYTSRRYNNVCDSSAFTISASPSPIFLRRGATATFYVYVAPNGYCGPVSLRAYNLPGAVLSGTGFNPQTLQVSPTATWFVSTLTIRTNYSTPRGTFDIRIEGQGGGRTVSTTVRLYIS